MRRLMIASLAVLLSGCIQLEMLLKVKKDGTGTFAETVLFDVALLEDFLKRLPTGAQAAPKPWEINEAELKKQASERWKGVTFVSAKPEARGRFKGYTASYTFTDVRQISIDPDPGKHAPQSAQAPAEEKGDPMRFDFKKGRTSELIVMVPREDDKKKDAETKKIDPKDESFEMMRGLLRDMKVQIQVEVDGKVESSNAKFREGNRITLMALDFNGLINDADKLAKVMNAGSYDEAAAAFNSIPGVKMETQKQVKVAFK